MTVEVETFTRNFYRERTALVIWAESLPSPAGSDAVPPPSLSFVYYSRDLGHQSFPRGAMVKNPPAVQEMQVRSLGWEDLLEKETAFQDSCLGNTEKPGRLQSMGLQESDVTQQLNHHM